MHYVYILKSILEPSKTYIGYISNLKQRLADHNSGKSYQTSKYKPWKIDFYCVF